MEERRLAILEKKAKKATKGRWFRDVPCQAMPWEVGVSLPWSDDDQREIICSTKPRCGTEEEPYWSTCSPRELYQQMRDADYIAAACPETILGLISEVKRLRKLLKAANLA
jgi:hypothetical protein